MPRDTKKIDWTYSGRKEKEKEKERRRRRGQGRRGKQQGRHRRHRLDGEPSPRELERLIDEACRFIEERKKHHASRFRWEIGEYLLLNVYEADERYLRKKDPTKQDSLRDIAARVRIEYMTLYRWVVAAVVRRKLAEMGHEPDLCLMHFRYLDKLRDHMDEAATLAELAEERGWTVREVEAAAGFWRDQLDQGASLHDLVRKTERRLSRRKKKAPSRTPPGLMRVPRVLMVAEGWWERATLSKRYRDLLRHRLLRLRESLAKEGRK